MADTSSNDLLRELSAEMDDIGRYRGTMSDNQKLTAEAYDCARHGDFDEARHRLRLRDEPKFSSIDQCKQQYKAAMVETRRARGRPA